MTVPEQLQYDDSADFSSRLPIGADEPPAIPVPGASGTPERKIRKRERAWIILLLFAVGLGLIELIDRFWGIPNR